MPPSDHAEHHSRPQSDPARRGTALAAAGMSRRQAAPLDVNDPSSSLLSPIVSHFPAFPAFPNLKGLLPSSPTKQQTVLIDTSRPAVDGVKAVWQEADLGDGGGVVPLLLVTSPIVALQILIHRPSSIPRDPHSPEVFGAPQEVFYIPKVRYDDKVERSALPGVGSANLRASTDNEQVQSAAILPDRKVILTTMTPGKKGLALLAVVLVDMNSGLAVRRLEIGAGTAAEIQVSSKIIAVAVSHPTPSIHLLDPISLSPARPSISGLVANPLTQLPVIALSGRLLAHTISTPPHFSRPDGLGSIITSTSLSSSVSPFATSGQNTFQPETPQGALINSAVEIGGGVARGVWAGIKLGARAASAATRTTQERLARSAPEGTTLGEGNDTTSDTGDAESRSTGNENVLEDGAASTAEATSAGGDWIKIIDLFARGNQTSSPDPESSVQTALHQHATTIAHFRLPWSSMFPIESHHSTHTQFQPVTYLSFSPAGTHLFAAPADGRSFYVMELHPAGASHSGIKGKVKGQVWNLYELKRGHTVADVKGVAWDKMGRWLGVGTGKGTVHVFPINPCGGPPSASTHCSRGIRNAQQLFSLSTPIFPVARLRPSLDVHETATPERTDLLDTRRHSGATFSFLSYRPDPSSEKSFIQDIGIFRPSSGIFDLARLHIQKRPDNNPVVNSDINGERAQRRGSALTEMMRNKAFGGQSDLMVDGSVQARWSLPGATEEMFAFMPPSDRPILKDQSRYSRMGYLASAEIRTHHTSTRVLPHSVYLSKQGEFFSARPIDDYSPLSMLDLEARRRRLTFRPEVEARSPTDDAHESTEKYHSSFDGPLLSAIHDIIESPPDRQIPGLPNGYGHGGPGRWGAIPIRTVRAGLNEGVDRFRREYARAQFARERKKEVEIERARKNQIGLSFEDDAVFAVPNVSNDLATPGHSPLASASASASVSYSGSSTNPPSSTALPPFKSGLEGDTDVENGWGEVWEEEYQKAVEDDGGPDDLVLGLMDEEDNERKKWKQT